MNSDANSLMWALVALSTLFTGFWCWFSYQGGLSVLSQRNAQVEMHLAEIGDKWGAIQMLSEKLLSQGSTDLAAPYFSLSRTASDRPSWMNQLLKIQPSSPLVRIRPQPVGMEAGRLSGPLPLETPELYWMMARGDLLLSLDLDYLKGPWLARQMQPLGPVEYELLAGSRIWGNPLSPRFGTALNPGWNLPWSDDDKRYPWALLRVQCHNAGLLQGYLLGQLGWLLVGWTGILAVGLGCLHLVRRYRQEWTYLLARQRFQALASHELRTPISAIQMYAEILRNQWVEDPAQVQKYHSIIGQEADRLGHLVENLLGMGRSSLSLKKRPVDLPELLSSLIRDRNWAVEVELVEPIPKIVSDPDALTLVLANLIQNGIKYGGSVEVRVLPREQGLRIEVADRGPGIPTAERLRIFEAYVRLDSEGQPGMGLGLALVKSFVGALGGQVDVSDRSGGGSIFRVDLP